ncbi:TetR/AcrR family transcriptional regulator [Corynebacterium sp. TAE3-ERU12]|uniref:TetR/AcrR family transcriptional regulator n=1 Tax=Corynebacterium sp. TAE3-ERU12 TaxID=2849491 RepID=UPI001C438D9E|nr:TetR/AcrR family transcriptional regulator [Corynebacterium sp. TAE3-ERU12]MBV7295613.1 TetR/AcrR family transcriptional regulator [Corynebacterium sp. TAE3-ERU12]
MCARIGKKTGPKPIFSIDDAVAAALRLGIDRFTLAGVAQELNIAAPSLYRVISSREDLLQQCLAYTSQQMEAPSASLSWQQQLREFVEVMWRVFDDYPGLSEVIVSTPVAHRHVQQLLDDMVVNLAAGGFPGDQDKILFAIDFIGDTVLSTHIATRPYRERGAEGLKKLQDQMRSSRGDNPVHFMPEEGWLDRGNLGEKVEFIIAGIEAGW